MIAAADGASDAGERPRRSSGLALRVALALALLAWLYFSGAFEFGRLLRLRSAPGHLALAFLFLAVATVVTALRLPVLLRPLGFTLGAIPAIQLALLGMFFNVFLPGGAGGDLAKIYYAVGGHDGQRAELATGILLDRGIGLVAMLAWPLLVLPFAWEVFRGSEVIAGLLLVSVGGALAALVALAAAIAWPQGLGARLEERFAGVSLVDLFVRVLRTLRSYRPRPGVLLANFGLSLVAHTFAVAGVLALAGAIVGTPSVAMALLVPLGFTANTLPLTPGGVGVGEVAFDRLFAAAGLEGGGEVMLAWRGLLILASLFGAIAYVDARRRYIDPEGGGEGDPDRSEA